MKTIKLSSNPDNNGFILLDNILGVIRYAMLSPLFRGARIRNGLGKLVLDLRHTSLEFQETPIHLICILGKITIYVPSGWDVRFQNNAIACHQNGVLTPLIQGTLSDKKVVLRGFTFLSSVEIVSD